MWSFAGRVPISPLSQRADSPAQVNKPTLISNINKVIFKKYLWCDLAVIVFLQFDGRAFFLF